MKKLDLRENIKVVTSNQFITACGLEKISLKARKLLYIAISQCKKNDKEFYEYSINIPEFAKLMDISPSNVYQEADAICDELAKGFIKIKDDNETKRRSLFSVCDNSHTAIVFQLNPDMTSLLLELKGNFSKPLLYDFLKMNSSYSIAIWHLMQRQMKSKLVGITDTIEFDLTLEELRQITGTEKTFERLSDFKRYVLDKAIREIKDNCGVIITYTNIKRSRTVVGFHFSAVNPFHMEESDLSEETRQKVKEIKRKQALGLL